MFVLSKGLARPAILIVVCFLVFIRLSRFLTILFRSRETICTIGIFHPIVWS